LEFWPVKSLCCRLAGLSLRSIVRQAQMFV
jgi:hypothetical protein